MQLTPKQSDDIQDEYDTDYDNGGQFDPEDTTHHTDYDDEMLADVHEVKERKKAVRLDKSDTNYVVGKEINEAADVYAKAYKAWKDSDFTIPRPVMSDTLAIMIKKIATRTVYNPKFIKFPSIRDEMVSGAIMDCIAYGHNFNIDAPTRSGQVNAFSYFSTICMNAYIKRIQTEKSQYMIKVKYVQSSEMAERIDEIFEQCDDESSYGVVSQIRHYYNVELPKPKRKPTEDDPDFIPAEPSGLELFLED